MFLISYFKEVTKSMSKKKDVVQIKNPKSGHYVKVDREAGKIINHKKSSSPYKNIPIIGGERMRQNYSYSEREIAEVYCDRAEKILDYMWENRENKEFINSLLSMLTGAKYVEDTDIVRIEWNVNKIEITTRNIIGEIYSYKAYVVEWEDILRRIGK